MNEICTHFGYDEFGRPTRRWDRVPTDVARSNNTNANSQIHWMYHAPGELAGLDTYMMTEWQNPRAEGNFVRKHYNGLGQLVLEQTPYANWSSGGGNEIHVNYAYDGLGRQIRASTPRLRGQGIWSTAVAWDSVAHTRTEYDSVDRITKSIAPNGQTTVYGYDVLDSSGAGKIRATSMVMQGLAGEGDAS